MAIAIAPGWGNLPQGNAFPEVFSQNVLMGFRRQSVVDAISNTNYSGEIQNSGDTVHIIKEPDITVSALSRGQEITFQDLNDEELQLVIDKSFYYGFAVDDIEKQLSHINWGEVAANNASYKLTQKFDTEVLQYMADNATTDTTLLGSGASPVTIGYGTGNTYTPLDLINQAMTILDENDVPNDGMRWFLATPAFYQQLTREDGKLIDVSVTGDPESPIRNQKYASGKDLFGFTMFKSNNTPIYSSTVPQIMFGHKSSTATATVLRKADSGKREKAFGEYFKGMMVYGRKVIRPEALFTGFVSLGDV